MMNKKHTPLSISVRKLEEKSRRDGVENEYLIQENARLRRELKELKSKIEGKKI